MVEQALAEAGAERAQSLMIGDTSYDIAMGKAAGVMPVGVAWGYHDHKDLLDAGAAVVAESPAQVLDFAREMADG